MAELISYMFTGLSSEFCVLKHSSIIYLLMLSTIWRITWSISESLTYYNCVWPTKKLSVIIFGLFILFDFESFIEFGLLVM